MSQSESDAPSLRTITPTSSPSLQHYYRDRFDNLRQCLPEAARQLQAAGVVRVHIEYDGCGDSGQIDTITYFDSNGTAVDPDGQVTLTEDDLLNLFYDLIQARHPSWEDHDGAFGEFKWDLQVNALQHTHNCRFTDYSTTEHDGL